MLSSRDDDCKCSCRHPFSVLCAAWQGHLPQVFLRVVGERHRAGIRENFSVPLVPQVQCCELLWITIAQDLDVDVFSMNSELFSLSLATCLDA